MGMRRNPVSSGEGLESRAMRTSALSSCGANAASGTRSPSGGSMPQPAASSAAAPRAATERKQASPATIHANGFRNNGMLRLLATLLVLLAPAAHAALDVNERTPDNTAPAARGGKVYKFSLSDALKKGPVVRY